MPRWLILLRGVNVGGKGTLPMADLREALPGIGARNVSSYIQSGNLVLEHDETDAATLAGAVSALIEARFGFAPPALALTPADLTAILTALPDPGDIPPNQVYIYLSHSALPDDLSETLAPYCTAGETLHAQARALAVLAPKGIGRSKLGPPLDRHLRGQATARNLTTLRRLQTLLDPS